MTRWISMAAVLLCAGSAWGKETLAEFSWSKLQAAGRVKNGTLVPGGKGGRGEALAVENSQSKSASITVLTVERPKITAKAYAIRGRVKYADVEGKGYLEMWSFFPGGGRYFTRTLAGSGPMRGLRGSSAWREFVLPFQVKDAAGAPQKLVINVVLPGKGKVAVGPMRLVQYEGGEDPLAAAGQWWTGRQGGWIGGICGALFGCLGGLIGLLSTRGKARGFVMGALAVMVVVGAAGLGVGLVALAKSQPYAVFYPPLLVGVLMTAIPLGMFRGIRRRYEQIELRKMAALDAS